MVFFIPWRVVTENPARRISTCSAHKPRLLSDNGSSYVSAELENWLIAQNMGHVRGAPYHPQTQGKIERWLMYFYSGQPMHHCSGVDTPGRRRSRSAQTVATRCRGLASDPASWD